MSISLVLLCAALLGCWMLQIDWRDLNGPRFGQAMPLGPGGQMVDVPGPERLLHGRTFQQQTECGQFLQLGNGNRGDLEAALFLGDHEAF